MDASMDERAAGAEEVAGAPPALVPEGFEVPQSLVVDEMLLRMLSASDVDADLESVLEGMPAAPAEAGEDVSGGGNHLQSVFCRGDTWPWPGMTREEDLADLRNHEREFELRVAFAYTVFDVGNPSRCLGCCYFNPCTKPGFDVEVFCWVRHSLLGAPGAADLRLQRALGGWIQERWVGRGCFPGGVVWPGRWVELCGSLGGSQPALAMTQPLVRTCTCAPLHVHAASLLCARVRTCVRVRARGGWLNGTDGGRADPFSALSRAGRMWCRGAWAGQHGKRCRGARTK
jgi:hypothetical protein